MDADRLTSDIIALHDGRVMIVHAPSRCGGDPCCVHNPSDHPLRDAPLSWWPFGKMMFRICPHGEPHPDPDDLVAQFVGLDLHTCDGCCRGERT